MLAIPEGETELLEVDDLIRKGQERGPRTLKHPVLKTEAAYDVAYDTIFDSLPKCRNCRC